MDDNSDDDKFFQTTQTAFIATGSAVEQLNNYLQQPVGGDMYRTAKVAYLALKT